MSRKRIFISSTGRTATQFFATYLNLMIKNSDSIHEPGTPWLTKPKRLLNQLKLYGLYHLSVGQSRNDYSMYKLSRDYIAGDIEKSKASKNILAINGKVDEIYTSDVIVYSSGHIYGLLGLLDEVYDDSKFIFIIRDPREWISSALNKNSYTLYGPVELIFNKISLQPSCFKNDEYANEWKNMSKFEKYCWFYTRLNENALKEMQNKPNFKIFKYEDIFLSDNKVENFKELLDFATDFNSGPVECDFKPDLITKKVDSKQSKKAVWKSWSPKKARIMMKHCGALMETFGYGNEEEWLNKIHKY